MQEINRQEIALVSGGELSPGLVTRAPIGNIPKPGGSLNLPIPTPAPPPYDGNVQV
jgi:hypothetical protein